MPRTIRAFSFSLLALTLAFSAKAQLGSNAIRGTVTDSDKSPVAFVNVFVPELNWGTTGDAGGYFSLRGLEPGMYTLKVSALGYEDREEKVLIDARQVLDLDIVLKENAYNMPGIEITGMRNQTLRKLPGSAARIDSRELSLLAPVSGNEVFRRAPGVHVVDEEGAGLRTNIGIRGLDPDRSRTVLILEDGIPVSLNPYGEPEMYFTPSMDRMAGVEIIKGAGQIAYGPRTIGGVINYLTPDPPQEEEVNLKLQGGQGGYFSGLVSYGNTNGNTGVHVSFLRRQADDMAGLNFTLNDFNAKIKQRLSDKSSVGLKIGVYDETSNSTYIGLTQTMWDAGGQDFVRMAPDDRLRVSRYSVSAVHKYEFNPNTSLRTALYAYSVTRDWRRQDFSFNSDVTNQSGTVWGDPSVPGGAVYMRNSTGNRNRTFHVLGAESKLTHRYEAFGLRNELSTGIRGQLETADEQRINGTFPTALSGDLVNDELRTGRALSAFAENKVWLSDKLSATIGLRGEHYDFEREIFRTQSEDVYITGGNTVSTLIPGAGVNYNLDKNTTLFAGVHRGFAPPRLKDAITAAGVAYELDAELSINYEAGFRSVPLRGITFEATAFMMDFDNQIIPVSESAGGFGAGEVNAGRTMHRGVETAFIVGIGELTDLPFRLDFDANITYVDAFFNADRFIGADDARVNINGNRTPYAPEWLASSALTFEMKNGFGLRFTGTYVSEQFTDEINSVTPTANGRDGRIDAYLVLDGTARYTIAKHNVVLSLSCKNITDERYMVSRRPQGIRAGLPRFITGGVSVKF